jgi:isopenicillin N synthase-like dioxygenase
VKEAVVLMQQEETQDFDTVPIIDISGLYSSEREIRAKTAGEIGSACKNVGFFYVKNHQVPVSVVVRF